MKALNNFSTSDSAVFNHPHWKIDSGDYIPKPDEVSPSLFQFRIAENFVYNGFLFTFSLCLTSLVFSFLLLL